MGQNNVLPRKSKSRSLKEKNLNILKAESIEPFVLRIFFNNFQNRIVDFRPFFENFKGEFKKFNSPSAFKKFKIKNEGMVWGKNADVLLHPLDIYYNSILTPIHDDLTEDLIVL